MKETFGELGFPKGTRAAQQWTTIIRQEAPLPLSERTSSRMIKLAANLPEGEWIGWQAVIPTDGSIGFSSFGSKTIKRSDLEWIAEETADTNSVAEDTLWAEPTDDYADWQLYEIVLPIAENEENRILGFTNEASNENDKATVRIHLNYYSWPQSFGDQFGELIEALRIEGAGLRFVAGSASIDEQRACIKQVERTWTPVGNDISNYVGYPVRTRLLLVLPTEPAARIRANVGVCVPGAELHLIGKLTDEAGKEAWFAPLTNARVLPDYAARIMAFEPYVGKAPVIGVEAREPEAKLVPARHKDSSRGIPIAVGKAMDISGMERTITVSDEDLRRHWQIIGQTGTGKSTLLASVIREAIQTGHGVTFFDPHGSTIDFVLRILPKEYAERVRVVRIGDINNPVPVNMWETDDPSKAERTIADMCLLFQEIFDPRHEGFVGPRWERMFSLLAQTCIAIFGKRASFESIVTVARNKLYIKSAATIIRGRHSALADSLMSEWGNNNSDNFTDSVAWFISKFQRLTSVEQLRNTLGAGANALDFDLTIDTETVTLVDLALPTIGTHAARIIGTMLLLQLWEAALGRAHRDKTHLLVIDEAHLFQTNPLPQMLAEGRKFGTALVLAHQYNGQLTYDVREAISANSANFSAFCLSVKDANEVRDRFDDPSIQRDLSRQNAFNAITTISAEGKQTPAFTLKIERPKEQADADDVSRLITANSIRTLVNPYKSEKPLTDKEIVEALKTRSMAIDEKAKAARYQAMQQPSPPPVPKPIVPPASIIIDDDEPDAR